MAGDRQNFMETKPVDRPGSMTVFFCLSLLLIGAMICTCLESARTAGLRFMSKTASDSALQSVFADYHEQLWEDYHVFFHYEENAIEDTLRQYLSYYENPSKGLYGMEQPTDLWGLSVDQISVVKKKNALSDGGRLFLEQAIMYEKYRITETILEELLGRMELLSEINKIRSFAAALSEGFEKIQQVSVLYQDVRDGLGFALQLGQQIQTMATAEVPDLQAICEAVESLSAQVGELRQRAERYLSGAGEISRLADELTEKYGDNSETIYGQQIGQLRTFAVNGLLGGAIDRVKDRTDEISGLLIPALAEMEKLRDAEGIRPADKEIATEMLMEAMNEGNRIMEELELDLSAAEESDGDDQGIEGAGDVHSGETKEQEGKSLLEEVKQWKNTAVLSLVMGSEAAQTPISYFSEPERLPSNIATEPLEDVTAAEKGLFVFYVADTFTSALSRQQTGFAYQQEYILFGKSDSRSNLSAMAERLLAVREGLNLAFLLTNARMRGLAESVAYALVGGTGIYPLVLLTQFVLLAAWAFAESVADVRELFAGETVPVWKTESTWRTSVGGAVKEWSSQGIVAENAEMEIKLSYSDYLRIFLLMKDTHTLCLRSMDIIQQEIGSRQRGFSMTDCLGEAEVAVGFSSPFRLIVLPMVEGNVKGRHQIKTVSTYIYR